ncbi:MAG: hypothetical protein ABF335_03105 [Alphaproteobacteria bacterium]
MGDRVEVIDIDDTLVPAGVDVTVPGGVFMAHQAAWVADNAAVKAMEKGRRTGITFAEALDDTITATTKMGEGGSNVFYIGDTYEKGREFIMYCANFARQMGETFLIEEIFPDGSEKKSVADFRIKFASGYRIEALSSRPQNIRGLQGIVVIDEAAFHKDVREVIDSAMALLIWGGCIRIISSHNGDQNPFNEFRLDIKAGKYKGASLHKVTFDDAVTNGLFKRVCLRIGKPYTTTSELAFVEDIRGAYGPRHDAMAEELDCVPKQGTGVWLTLAAIQQCHTAVPVARWSVPSDFLTKAEVTKKAEVELFFETEITPVLKGLSGAAQHFIGVDFARFADRTAFWVLAKGDTPGKLATKLVVELGNMPFNEQRDLLFKLIDAVPRVSGVALDAGGNGAWLAEETLLKIGATCQPVNFTSGWYAQHMPHVKSAIEDRTLTLPDDDDLTDDLRSVRLTMGVPRLPKGPTKTMNDGSQRHGDGAIALALAVFASNQPVIDYSAAAGTGTERTDTSAFTGEQTTPGGGAGFGSIPGGADLSGF